MTHPTRRVTGTTLRRSPAVLATLVALAPAASLSGQAARDSVLATVQEFFRTMTANDRSAAARVVAADGQYYAVRQDPESLTVRRVTHAEYLDRLRPGADRMVERLWDPTVLVHGPIAAVWAPYDIHRNGRFLHCGVDHFSLVRLRDGWKVVGATFTMEPTGCRPSPLGPLPEREARPPEASGSPY
jgi:hypothetical protein